MDKSLQELCLELAGHADTNRYSVLAYLLRVAAAEAERSAPFSHVVDFSLNSPGFEKVIGVWDVDVSTNTAYFDAVGAGFFGQNAGKAARGVSVGACIGMIHPDDVGVFTAKFDRAVRKGSDFVHEYRVIANDRIRWMHADGNCTLDQAGRPMRAIGSLVDITDQKELEARRISLAPH